MGDTAKKGHVRLFGRSASSLKSAIAAAFIPRYWKVLIALAIPFIWVSAGYLEHLEKMGSGWAGLADVSLSALIFGYLVFIFILGKQDI